MGDDKKSDSPMSNPIAWVFRASVLLLGAVVALNLAVAWLRPLLPWLMGGIAIASTIWIAVAIIKWRRSKF
ncbi:hypothetical protein L1857_08505 [Amycolatopsis thermalba]|uniref:Uncharacterized protein n=1 Tax=Amycolatopsis thermalba TaxID=944492 RepID=A0ABY4NS05_9PSEU|nr:MULTISPECIES: hypothetical protein [Amycolatopsis]UQS22854.1 hypothetical protein L1857_08505 [Amycolatopsis thermalba]